MIIGNDTWLHICCYLPIRDVATLQRVNKTLHALLSQDALFDQLLLRDFALEYYLFSIQPLFPCKWSIPIIFSKFKPIPFYQFLFCNKPLAKKFAKCTQLDSIISNATSNDLVPAFLNIPLNRVGCVLDMEVAFKSETTIGGGTFGIGCIEASCLQSCCKSCMYELPFNNVPSKYCFGCYCPSKQHAEAGFFSNGKIIAQSPNTSPVQAWCSDILWTVSKIGIRVHIAHNHQVHICFYSNRKLATKPIVWNFTTIPTLLVGINIASKSAARVERLFYSQ